MKKHFFLTLLVIGGILFGYTVIGQNTEDKKDLDKIYKSTYAIRDSLSKLYLLYFQKIKDTTDTTVKAVLQNEIDNLNILTERNDKEELNLEFEFIKQHPSSPLSLDIISFKMHRREGMSLYNKFNLAFNSLAASLQKSAKGVKVYEDLISFRESSIGYPAPDFALIDINNQKVTLNQFKNNSYVLIDFWASWCKPCRDDFPFLKKLDEKYNSQDFKIISISRDDNIESWKAAIQKDGINFWRQVSTKLNNNKVLQDYFVSAIPVKVLINKDGRIIKRWRGGGSENQSDLEQTLHNLFKR